MCQICNEQFEWATQSLDDLVRAQRMFHEDRAAHETPAQRTHDLAFEIMDHLGGPDALDVKVRILAWDCATAVERLVGLAQAGITP